MDVIAICWESVARLETKAVAWLDPPLTVFPPLASAPSIGIPGAKKGSPLSSRCEKLAMRSGAVVKSTAPPKK